VKPRRFPTRFEQWGRGPSVALLAALAALVILAAWPTPSAPAPRLRASATEQSDPDLYRAIIGRVAAGEPYYPAAADELRAGGYPLRPFVTFRLPTLALLHAHVPAMAVTVGQALLALAVLLVWWRRLAPRLPPPLLAVALILLVGGTAPMVGPVTGLFHESWAALLLALMIGLRRPGHVAAAIVAGIAALLVRETALPMILAMGGLALVERRWREAAGWAAAIALFGIVMLVHARMVAGVVTPGDLASPGWNALLGARFALGALASVSSATMLPPAFAATILLLSLFGWLSVRAGWALRAGLLLLGYGAMLALFARADTFYWALLAAPLSLAGLAFVPRALADLVRRARGVAQPTA
jgi:hypothetical protein